MRTFLSTGRILILVCRNTFSVVWVLYLLVMIIMIYSILVFGCIQAKCSSKSLSKEITSCILERTSLAIFHPKNCNFSIPMCYVTYSAMKLCLLESPASWMRTEAEVEKKKQNVMCGMCNMLIIYGTMAHLFTLPEGTVWWLILFLLTVFHF